MILSVGWTAPHDFDQGNGLGINKTVLHGDLNVEQVKFLGAGDPCVFNINVALVRVGSVIDPPIQDSLRQLTDVHDRDFVNEFVGSFVVSCVVGSLVDSQDRSIPSPLNLSVNSVHVLV